MAARTPLAPSTPRVSALLVSYNVRDLLLEALRSLEVTPGVEAIVVDNASQDRSAEAVAAAFPSATLVRSATNLGFARAVNLAAARARAPFLLLLNPDARLLPGALERMMDTLEEHPRAAVVGAALRYDDGAPQESAFAFPGLAQVVLDLFSVPRLAHSRLNGRYPASSLPREIDHPLGACMLIRRTAWEDIGPLDEGYFIYVEEVDWCRRARQRGWAVWHEPRAVAIHHAGQSTRQAANTMFVHLWRSRLRYYERHHGAVYNRLVRAVVRAGMDAERRRAGEALSGEALRSRLEALDRVRRAVA